MVSVHRRKATKVTCFVVYLPDFLFKLHIYSPLRESDQSAITSSLKSFRSFAKRVSNVGQRRRQVCLSYRWKHHFAFPSRFDKLVAGNSSVSSLYSIAPPSLFRDYRIKNYRQFYFGFQVVINKFCQHLSENENTSTSMSASHHCHSVCSSVT